jgi:hypothetical protein
MEVGLWGQKVPFLLKSYTRQSAGNIQHIIA